MSEHARQLAQKLRDDLQSPFGSLQDLCGVLVAPLLAFGLTRSGIPEQYKLQENPWLELDAQDRAYILKVYWAQFQEILATKIVIDWLDHLREDNLDKDLWLPFFCPSKTSFYFVSVIRVSLSTLPTILVNKSVTAKLSSTAQKAAPLPEFVKQTSIQSLAQVAQAVTLCDIFTDIFRSQNQEGALLDWQAFFDRYVALPSRVANAIGDTGDTPQALEWRVFYISLSRQFETQVYATSNSQGSATARDALVYGLGKIARSGFMNHEQGRTTFWPAIMPVLRRHLLAKTCSKDLIEIWQQMVASLSTTDYRTCVSSLMASMSESLNAADDARSVRRASVMMSRILGPVTTDNERLWSTTIKGVFLSKFWSPPVARTLSLWAAGDSGNAVLGVSHGARRFREPLLTRIKLASASETSTGYPGALVGERSHRESTNLVPYL